MIRFTDFFSLIVQVIPYSLNLKGNWLSMDKYEILQCSTKFFFDLLVRF